MEIIKIYKPFIANIELTEEEVKSIIDIFGYYCVLRNKIPDFAFDKLEKEIYFKLKSLLK